MKFLRFENPPLVTMVQADNPNRIKELVALSKCAGAQAFGVQFCRMKSEYRRPSVYRDLFSAAAPDPVYVTNYRLAENAALGKSDDTLASELLELAECGASLCDVMGDMFDKQEGELTCDARAIEKQMCLIDELHSRGAEVLMSSHVHKFISAECVLKIALEHQRRGADISKIVVRAENMAEQIENLRIINMLKEKLNIPFVLLSGGTCQLLRRVGAAVGNCMTLCVYEYDEYATPIQPKLSDMVQLNQCI